MEEKELKTIVIYKEDHSKLVNIASKNKNFRDIIHDLLSSMEYVPNEKVKGGYE